MPTPRTTTDHQPARRQRKPHQVQKRNRCLACGKVFPKPYKRKYFAWGEVHYVRCECGEPDAIDVL